MIKHDRSLFNLVVGIILVLAGLSFPEVLEFLRYEMIVDIRSAIVSGDSGHLVLTGAGWSLLAMFRNIFIFNGVVLFVWHFWGKHTKRWVLSLGVVVIFTLILNIYRKLFGLEIEHVTVLLSALLSMGFISLLTQEQMQLPRTIAISVQVFFAFQWLNLLPVLTGYGFGVSDIPGSIKLSATYLGSASVFNFLSLAFFAILILSSSATYVLFVSYDYNIRIAGDNYQKQMELDSMKAKAVESRMYEEINAVAHDLKTPLVTIEGLNSLIAMTNNPEKVTAYTARIDGAVTKMKEMISAFLYESAKQVTNGRELIDYVRAQTPMEDDQLSINFIMADSLPDLYINKIRVSRAIINIIENAIAVPTIDIHKSIDISVYELQQWVVIEVKDNGVGITEKEMARIWEVGFSTRHTTGIGMNFVRKVIEDNGGDIEIRSNVHKGTRVITRLPKMNDTQMEE